VADPMTVQPGQSSTITATGVSPQNRSLTYTFSSSAGTINGSGNTATLSTTGAPSGPVTVTCNVQDDKGQTASSTTTVDVQAPPPPPTPHTEKLCTITFDRDKYRPTRVDNEAKACLDDVALNAQRQPDSTLVLVGNSAPGERDAAMKAAERAVNAKQYLVKDKGIDASRIQVRTDNSGSKEVEDYLVPSGANFENDIPGTEAVNESELHPHHVYHPYRHHKVTHKKKM
jgi:outer membrane protein OmpA-like peptidoglycan-associated protein